MLNSLRRMFSRGSTLGDPAVIQAWSQQRGAEYRRVRAHEGCVVEGRMGSQAWRLEWGPSQRSYVPGAELRLLAELELPKELQVMLLNRQLMEATEKAVYEHYVDDVQTRLDTETPPEMRWLVMYAKAGPQDLGRLRERYGAVGSIMPWLQKWLASPLHGALANTIDMVPLEQPVVLSIGRGRLVLRTSLTTPTMDNLVLWHSVFEHALREARRLGAEWRDASGIVPSTQPEDWLPGETAASPYKPPGQGS